MLNYDCKNDYENWIQTLDAELTKVIARKGWVIVSVYGMVGAERFKTLDTQFFSEVSSAIDSVDGALEPFTRGEVHIG